MDLYVYIVLVQNVNPTTEYFFMSINHYFYGTWIHGNPDDIPLTYTRFTLPSLFFILMVINYKTEYGNQAAHMSVFVLSKAYETSPGHGTCNKLHNIYIYTPLRKIKN